MKKIIEKILVALFGKMAYGIVYLAKKYNTQRMKKRAHLHPSVVLGDVYLDKNVFIGENTYFNSGQVYAGENSKVVIGKNCAIGYNVRIKARTHNPLNAAAADDGKKHERIEADIFIGDGVWIGDNVFVKHGITIGNDAVVGANSVVTKDIPEGKVAAGVPARILYDKHEEQKKASSNN